MRPSYHAAWTRPHGSTASSAWNWGAVPGSSSIRTSAVHVAPPSHEAARYASGSPSRSSVHARYTVPFGPTDIEGMERIQLLHMPEP